MTTRDPGVRRSAENDLEPGDEPGRRGIVFELLDFLRHNKRWWLTPILILLAAAALLLAWGDDSVAPFLYDLL